MSLCRMCMAPAFPVLRLGALRHYNKAFGKLEHICWQRGECVVVRVNACMIRLVYYLLITDSVVVMHVDGTTLVSTVEQSCLGLLQSSRFAH